MGKISYTILFVALHSVVISQSDTVLVPEKPWKLESIFGLNGTQSSFVNWSAGGRNNVSALAFINASAYYTKDLIKWDTDLNLHWEACVTLGRVQEAKPFRRRMIKLICQASWV